ncbi:hypothetical protein ABE354_16070 [Brevibacillus laterosporus]
MKKQLLKLTALMFGLVLVTAPLTVEAKAMTPIKKPSVSVYILDPGW